MKKRFLIAGLMALVIGAFTSCSYGRGFVTGHTYIDSDKYSIGELTYNKNDIDELNIDWISGQIEIVQSEQETLKVYENSESLLDAQKMHYYLNEKTLNIQFCESGYTGTMDNRYKRLRVEVPANISYNIYSVSGDLKSGDIEAKGFSFKSISGSLDANKIKSPSIKLETTSGNFNVRNIETNSFEVSSISGQVRSDVIDAKSIKVNTTSGNMEIGIKNTESLIFNSISASAKITLKEDMGLKYSYTTISGSFNTNIEVLKKDEHQYGDGKCTITIITTSGTLTINK